MPSPDVTVVVPCYNTEDYLDQALCSIESNDRCTLEILVINDGSTDGSLAVMRAHEARDARVRVIDKPNQGYGATVNRGFDEARGDYLAIVEPDDYVEPHMYDDLIGLARTFPVPPDIVKSSYWRIWMPETPRERRLHCNYYRRIRPSHQPFRLVDCPRLIQHHPSIWSALYRRMFLVDAGIRLREVPGAGWVDNPFLIETMCQANSIVYTDDAYYCYREDLPGSSSATRVLSLSFERWNDMCDVMDRLRITDRGIRRALDVIGFRYVGEAVGRGALDDPDLREGIRRIFSRMDPADIVTLDTVSPQLRALAFTLTGRPAPRISRAGFYRALASEFFYSTRVNGLGFALARVGVFGERSRTQDANADPSKEHTTDMPSGM